MSRIITAKSGKVYTYQDRHYSLAMPKDLFSQDFEGFEWIPLKETCYDSKVFPYCEKCKTKYVPIDGKCFKCQFKSNGRN